MEAHGTVFQADVERMEIGKPDINNMILKSCLLFLSNLLASSCLSG